MLPMELNHLDIYCNILNTLLHKNHKWYFYKPRQDHQLFCFHIQHKIFLNQISIRNFEYVDKEIKEGKGSFALL